MEHTHLLFKEVIKNTQFFSSEPNVLFHVPAIFNVPLPLIFILLISIVLIFNYHAPRAYLKWSLGFMAIVIIFQSIAQARHFFEMERGFRHKSMVEKKTIVWGRAFKLIDCAKTKLKGQRLAGQFITDTGTNQAPIEFPYELYPVIDLVSPASQPQVRVCFADQGCKGPVPNNFHVICSVDNGYIALINQAQVK